jgi:hypothetical protein
LGWSGDFATAHTFPKWAEEFPVVVLGIEPVEGSPHCIALRGGVLLDSLQDGPKRFNNETLARSLKHVFMAVVIWDRGVLPSRRKRVGPTRIGTEGVWGQS